MFPEPESRTTTGWHHHGELPTYGCVVEDAGAVEYGTGGGTGRGQPVSTTPFPQGRHSARSFQPTWRRWLSGTSSCREPRRSSPESIEWSEVAPWFSDSLSFLHADNQLVHSPGFEILAGVCSTPRKIYPEAVSSHSLNSGNVPMGRRWKPGVRGFDFRLMVRIRCGGRSGVGRNPMSFEDRAI